MVGIGTKGTAACGMRAGDLSSHPHALRMIPTFVARMSQTTRAPGSTVSSIHMLQDTRHICGPYAARGKRTAPVAVHHTAKDIPSCM
jgi:hypothetical protein